MSSVRRGLCTAAVALFLAGCGGSQTATPPVSGPDGAGRTVHVAFSPSPSPSPTPMPPPVGTLYSAETASVNVYPLGSNGTTAPTRTIAPNPSETQILRGLAVDADKSLAILEDYFTGTGNAQADYCRVLVESATASGSPAALGTHLCDPQNTGQAEGIAANTAGGYDVLFTDTVQSKDVLRRFGSDGASVVNTVLLDFFPLYLATDRGAHDYLDTPQGRIVSYKTATTDPAVKATDVTLAGNPALGTMAVSQGADRTVYVVAGSIGNQSIYALAPGSSTISRTIGPFPNNYVSAMAVDSQGSLYVAFNPNGGGVGSFIRVYDSAANGKPAPLRSIYPNPASSYIRGLAISE